MRIHTKDRSNKTVKQKHDMSVNPVVCFFSVQSAPNGITCPICGSIIKHQLTLSHEPIQTKHPLKPLRGPHTYPICECVGKRLAETFRVIFSER